MFTLSLVRCCVNCQKVHTRWFGRVLDWLAAEKCFTVNTFRSQLLRTLRTPQARAILFAVLMRCETHGGAEPPGPAGAVPGIPNSLAPVPPHVPACFFLEQFRGLWIPRVGDSMIDSTVQFSSRLALPHFWNVPRSLMILGTFNRMNDARLIA